MKMKGGTHKRGGGMKMIGGDLKTGRGKTGGTQGAGAQKQKMTMNMMVKRAMTPLLWARGKEKEKAMERRRKRGNMPEEGLPEKEERRAELEIDQGPMKYGSSGGASPRLGC